MIQQREAKSKYHHLQSDEPRALPIDEKPKI
jgi:hypothetical protein